MHITKIKTNCKGGGIFDLGPLTIVMGKNGVGKSAVVSAVELALIGRSTDVGALPADLLTLAPIGQPLKVEAMLSDGRSIEFVVEGTTARAKKARWTDGGPFGVLLGREVVQALSGRPDRLRAAILSIAAGEVDEATISAAIPTAFQPQWDRLIAEARSAAGHDTPMADLLIAVSDQIRKELREVRAEADGGLRPEAPSDDEIDRIRAEVDRLRVGGGDRDRAEAIRAIEAALVVQQFGLGRADDYTAVCVACEIDHAVADLAAVRDRTLGRLARLRNVPAVDDAAARAAIEAEARLADAIGRQAIANEWDRRRVDDLAAAARGDALRALEGCVRRIVEETLPAAVTGFVDRANRAMEGSDRIAVQLFDRRKPVCRIGLDRAGHVIPYRALSGAERARVLAALACAWASGRSDPARLVVIDDVWIDRESLAALLAGLGRVVGTDGGPTQAIVCVVEGDVPGGWIAVRP